MRTTTRTEAFKVKYNKEVAVTDVRHANVFLFDGKMLDENSQEFYFEEFCYKQFKFKEHNADVKKESLGVVARRQLGGVGGGIGGVGVGSVSEAGSVGGFNGGVGSVGVSEAGFNGGVGAFDSDSFLNGFSGVDGGESRVFLGSCLAVSRDWPLTASLPPTRSRWQGSWTRWRHWRYRW